MAEITEDTRFHEIFEHDPATLQEMVELKELAADYASSFDEMSVLQGQRNELVAILSKVGPETRLMLTEIMETAYADGDIQAAFYVGIAQQELMLGRFYMERFLLNNDQDAFARVGKHFSSASEQMEVLLESLENPRRRELAQSVIANKQTYGSCLGSGGNSQAV